jgi:Domain of unknown function (DUF3883)
VQSARRRLGLSESRSEAAGGCTARCRLRRVLLDEVLVGELLASKGRDLARGARKRRARAGAGTGRSIVARSSSHQQCRSRACSSESLRRSSTRRKRRLGAASATAYIDEHGAVEAAGPAPYLDCVAAPITPDVIAARGLSWLAEAEERAASWIIANELPAFLDQVRARRDAELRRVRERVERRLAEESNRLVLEAMVAQEQEQAGKKPRESQTSLMLKAADLDARRTTRLALLDRQLEMQATPPRVVTAALILPLAAVEADIPAEAPMHAVATKEVERRGVECVLAAERLLGRLPVEQAFNNPGFDVLSQRNGEDPIRIEVKARIAGADDFFVTHNELLTALNSAPRYRLALVRVDPRGRDHDVVRYLENPFSGFDAGDFDATGHRGKWDTTWARGHAPF